MVRAARTSILSFVIFLSPFFVFASSLDHLIDSGKSYYFQGDYANATREFGKALLLDPSSLVAQEYLNRAQAKIHNQNVEDLLSMMEDVHREKTAPLTTTISQREQQSVSETALPESAQSEDDYGISTVGQDAIQLPPSALLGPSSQGPSNIPETSQSIQQDIEKADVPSAFDGGDINQTPLLTKQPTPAPSVPSETNIQDQPKGPIVVTGDYQIGFGVDMDEDGSVYWKRSNYDLNEENWRTLDGTNLNNFENTYDPAIFSKLHIAVDDNQEKGLGFHTDLDISPWSFVGKSNKLHLDGQTWIDDVELQVKYWSNSGYTVNETVYTLQNGDSLNIPEMKLINGRILPVTLTSLFGNTYTIPEVDISREFWPLREMWFDYTTDVLTLTVFPAALQSKAYTSDDILGLSNRKVYWEESPWLDSWAHGHLNNLSGDFSKGYWDDSLSFYSKDYSASYLTNLRGISVEYDVDLLSFDATLASPKTLWQEYDLFDTYAGASRMKYLPFENLQIGTTYTGKLGYYEDKLDATSQTVGVDVTYGISDTTKVGLGLATSRATQDKTSPDYETQKRGHAFKFDYTASSEADIFAKDYFAIRPEEKSAVPFYRLNLGVAHMDKGFEAALSNYHETRDDSFWSRHIHFRKPFDYYYSGLYGTPIGWADIEPYKIGDGIDYGRDVIRMRCEWMNLLDSNFDGLFDTRNVHDTNGKFIENVTHIEGTYRIGDKFTAKALGIHHKLPKTQAGVDPFLVNADTMDPLENSEIVDGKDPTLKTGSVGAEYAFTDWLSLDATWEHTNDLMLASDNFPRGLLTWTSFATYTEYGNVYRELIQGLNHEIEFPLPEYPYFDIFKAGLRLKPVDKLELYFDWTRNEYEWAQAMDSNFNHIGLEAAYLPVEKLALYARYTYSYMNDYSELNNNQGVNQHSHHNFFSEIRYRPLDDREIIFQYGVGGLVPIGVITGSPFGGSLPVLDTQHIIRMFYRKKF